jgi:hypothetical protein
MGSTTYTLRPSTIRETAGGFENVFQVFQVLPGAAAINDEGGKLAVRGAGPEPNIVVLDGVQIHNPYRFSELTSSFLNPETAATVALDASGLDASVQGKRTTDQADEPIGVCLGRPRSNGWRQPTRPRVGSEVQRSEPARADEPVVDP